MKGKTSHDPHTAYYLDQAGSGISKFRGLRVQRGGGLGGFFSSLIRGAVPLIKAGLGIAAPHAIKMGRNVVGDVLSGQHLGRAVKSRGLATGKAVGLDVFKKVLGNGMKTGHKRKKRTTPPTTLRTTAVKKRRIVQRPDAF